MARQKHGSGKASRSLTRAAGMARNPGMSAKRTTTPAGGGKSKKLAARTPDVKQAAKPIRAAKSSSATRVETNRAKAETQTQKKGRAAPREASTGSALQSQQSRKRPSEKAAGSQMPAGGKRSVIQKTARPKSSRSRSGMLLARFAVGDVVRHKYHPFRGVIFDIDPVFANTEDWWLSIPEKMRPKKNQPFYHLLAENSETEYIAYVSEQNLVADTTGVPVRHPQVAEYFEEDDDGRYRPVFLAMLN